MTRIVSVGCVLALASVLSGCTSDVPPAADTTTETVSAEPAAPEVVFSEVSCAGAGESWVGADDLTREKIVAASSSTDSHAYFGAEYVGVGPARSWIAFRDGSVLETQLDVFDFACAEYPELPLGDALATLFEGGEPQPTCTEYIRAEKAAAATWLEVANRMAGEAVGETDIAKVCGAYRDRDLLDAVASASKLLDEIRLSGFQWSSGTLLYEDEEGYTAEATFSGELYGFSSDITNSPPGYTEVTFTVGLSLTWTNTTPGRRNSSLFHVGVSPVWPEDSDVCRVLHSHGDGWANIAPEFLWNTGPYCLPQTELGPGAWELGPGESTTSSTSQTWTQEVAEEDLPAIEAALAGDGAPFWIAYVGLPGKSNINYSGMDSSRECGVFNGAFHFSVIGISRDKDLANCPLDIG